MCLFDLRVIVFLPVARDSLRASQALTQAGIQVDRANTAEEVSQLASAGVGAILTAEELLQSVNSQPLFDFLESQPNWSDIPLVVLGHIPVRPGNLRECHNVILIERPVRMRSLMSAIRSALRSRKQQYVVRDYLNEKSRSEANHAYVVKLQDALRPISNPAQVQTTACQVLGEHFGANRVAYFQIENDHYVVDGDYHQGVASLAGHYRITSFGPMLLNAFMVGKTVVERDAWEIAGRTPSETQAFQSINVRGHVDVPLIKNGVFVGGMTIHFASPRTWSEDEVALIEATAERTWAAVERAKAERALRASEEQFRSLFESMDEGYCVVEPIWNDVGQAIDYRYVLANPALTAHTGLTNIVGKTALEVMPGLEAHWIEAYAQTAKTGQPYHCVELAKELNRWLDVSAFRLGDNQVGVLFTDVTTQRIAAEKLKTSEARLQLAVGIAHMGTFEIDLRSGEIAVNEPGRQILGWERLKSTFHHVQECFHPDDQACVMQHFATAFSADGPDSFDMIQRIVRTDHTVRWIKLCGKAFFEGDSTSKQAILCVGAFIDITDQKQAEDELRDADRKKDDFIALLAHELRNPLAPIRNGLHVLKLSAHPNIAAVDMMDRQLTHMVRLVDDLLDISRISRNKMELRWEYVDLRAVVSTAVETAKPVIDQAQHQLEITLPDFPVLLHADITRLAQVLSNLLTNAAKYTATGGRICLRATVAGSRVFIHVQDNGLGIPSDALPHIFDMFSQVDRSVERATGGLGIGLALVKALTETHGGTVSVESTPNGSTFTISLPIPKPQPDAQPRSQCENSAELNCYRVLVVDDNRDSADTLSTLLRIQGQDVQTAYDGEEAVHLASEFKPNLILMDVGMPKLNGYDAAREIRRHQWGKETRIVVLSGWGQDGDRQRSQDAGCDAHLIKPVSLQDLQKLLGDLSEGSASNVFIHHARA